MAEGETTTTATTDATTTATTAATTTAVTPSWRDTLPEDIRAAPELAKYQDIAALAKGHLEQSKLVGRKAAVPGPDAKPEEVTAFRKAMGVPDSPDGYQIKRPPIAAVLGWDEEAEKGFAAAAHKAGYTPQQAQAAVDWFASREQARHNADRAMEQQAGAALREAWGANYDANVGLANRALQQYGGDDLVEFLHTSRLGADPRMVKAWAAVGRDLAEHGVIEDAGLGGLSREEAQGKVAEIRERLTKMNPDSPEARELVEQMYRYLAVR